MKPKTHILVLDENSDSSTIDMDTVLRLLGYDNVEWINKEARVIHVDDCFNLEGGNIQIEIDSFPISDVIDALGDDGDDTQ